MFSTSKFTEIQAPKYGVTLTFPHSTGRYLVSLYMPIV